MVLRRVTDNNPTVNKVMVLPTLEVEWEVMVLPMVLEWEVMELRMVEWEEWGDMEE